MIRDIDDMTDTEPKPLDAHYSVYYRGHRIDPYRIGVIYGIQCHEQFHALKKLLRAGRSVKPLEQDIEEVILTLQCWQRRLKEDAETETL